MGRHDQEKVLIGRVDVQVQKCTPTRHGRSLRRRLAPPFPRKRLALIQAGLRRGKALQLAERVAGFTDRAIDVRLRL
jgi:hypothetical protein